MNAANLENSMVIGATEAYEASINKTPPHIHEMRPNDFCIELMAAIDHADSVFALLLREAFIQKDEALIGGLITRAFENYRAA